MEQFITGILHFSQLLNKSGLNLTTILTLGVLFSISLLISLREIILWYLKINKLQNQLDQINKSIKVIERRLGIEKSNSSLKSKPLNQLFVKNNLNLHLQKRNKNPDTETSGRLLELKKSNPMDFDPSKNNRPVHFPLEH
ncbi:MAG: hypothetical protein K1X29_02105 [Bdellovibrionales bacterium]|nr:hypothetical protein [Bdellovibrionales bacterium]